MFTRPDGGPLDGTVVTHQIHRLLDRGRLPQRRFHDLRHSCATLSSLKECPPECHGRSGPLADCLDYEHQHARLARTKTGRCEAKERPDARASARTSCRIIGGGMAQALE